MASDLKEKLRDPHFVAMRCDLDSSGDLDAHELKPLGSKPTSFSSAVGVGKVVVGCLPTLLQGLNSYLQQGCGPCGNVRL